MVKSVRGSRPFPYYSVLSVTPPSSLTALVLLFTLSSNIIKTLGLFDSNVVNFFSVTSRLYTNFENSTIFPIISSYVYSRHLLLLFVTLNSCVRFLFGIYLPIMKRQQVIRGRMRQVKI